jgi:hypothetical protein
VLGDVVTLWNRESEHNDKANQADPEDPDPTVSQIVFDSFRYSAPAKNVAKRCDVFSTRNFLTVELIPQR